MRNDTRLESLSHVKKTAINAETDAPTINHRNICQLKIRGQGEPRRWTIYFSVLFGILAEGTQLEKLNKIKGTARTRTWVMRSQGSESQVITATLQRLCNNVILKIYELPYIPLRHRISEES